MEKLLPQNIEAEEGVLGSIILDPEALTAIIDFLYAEDFYREAHSAIYTAIKHLYEQHIPADFITLCDELARQKQLEQVGGSSSILSLVNKVPTSANVEHYAHIVERTAIQRRLIHAAGQIAAIAYEETDAEAAIQKIEQLVFAITQGRQHGNDFMVDSDILQRVLRMLEEQQATPGALVGVPTGFSDLDFLTGGLQKSDLIVLAGRPGMGKSSLALSLARNAVGYDCTVAIFSLEMSKWQLMQRLLSMDTKLDLFKLRNGFLHTDGWEQISDSVATLSTNRLWIDDTAAISLGALCSRARRLHAQYPLDLIIVDYAQLMTVATSGKGEKSRDLVMGEITHGLKALAKELNIPILALAQLSRATEARASKVPQLSDLRESGNFENDADVVLLIYRDDYYNADSPRKGQADIIIAKHRNGPVGEVCLNFNAALTEFSNREGK